MEIRQLRYFLSAVRLGSLKAAAGEHFVTQPAVSIQLKKLQEELGEKLYLRRGRRIVPTQAGEMVVSQGKAALGRIDALRESVRGLGSGQGGFLRIGTIDAASIYVLPGAFRTFRRKYPGVEVQVTVADSDTLAAALHAGSIELAIVTLPLSGEGLEVVPFYNDRMVFVVSPRHELAGSRPAGRRPLQAAAEAGLITYPARSVTRRLIEKVFIENGLTLRAAMEMSSPEAIKRLTEAGIGASILPRKVVADELKRGTLRLIPTGRARFERTLGVVHGGVEKLSQPAAIFLTMLMSKHRTRRNRKASR
ncbi:MAG: LysR family transcriptional regulator [Candidatus Krumholzibacteriia bacterium]